MGSEKYTRVMQKLLELRDRWLALGHECRQAPGMRADVVPIGGSGGFAQPPSSLVESRHQHQSTSPRTTS